MMNKHAYLIMAHNQFEILEKIIKLLDDEKNDFYIHIDKKVKHFNFNKVKDLATKSNIFFVKRIDVKWGHFSQIECEILLLKSAIERNYSYYHLISGVDMPIKSKERIYDFFEKNIGKEFIHFENKEKIENNINRYSIYQFFPYYKRSKFHPILGPFVRFTRKIQKVLKMNRVKNEKLIFKKGAQWFSITNDLANYILSKENWIRKIFKFSYCCDEIFLQTLVFNSKFKKNVYNQKLENNHIDSIKRYIDWERGGPYIFREKDFDDLIKSEALFARKFDINIDKKIVNKIFEYYYRK